MLICCWEYHWAKHLKKLHWPLLNNAELWVHDRYSAAMKLEDLETVFQAGYDAGTCGEATTAQIKSYLASQFDAD